MCGLAGISGFSDPLLRRELIRSLGFGIDARGGHAAGFLSLTSQGDPLIGRREGHWMTARERWYSRASAGHTTMMHARYATCGRKVISEAHPFEVRRNGAPVLWGAHNGVLHGAEDSAKRHGRKYDVDSRELFELLADGDLADVSKLEGYGVITWIEAAAPERVLLAKLSAQSDIYVALTKCGGLVWGSTKNIVHDALDDSRLKVATYYNLEIGKVYSLECRGIFHTYRPHVTVSDYAPRWTRMSADLWPMTDWDDDAEEEELKRLEAETADGLLFDDSVESSEDDIAARKYETLEEQWKREERRNAAEWLREYHAAMGRDTEVGE